MLVIKSQEVMIRGIALLQVRGCVEGRPLERRSVYGPIRRGVANPSVPQSQVRLAAAASRAIHGSKVRSQVALKRASSLVLSLLL